MYVCGYMNAYVRVCARAHVCVSPNEFVCARACLCVYV